MSLTVLEQIGAKISTRLGGVSGATVIRPKQLGALPQLENKTILVVQGDAFKNEELSCEGNPYLQAWDQEYALDLFIREAESDTQPVDTRINDLYGKIIAKLTEPSRWETWDNLAVKTTIDSQTLFPLVNGVFSGMEITMTVTYRHRENNPYDAG
jgi:hypothetical protein